MKQMAEHNVSTVMEERHSVRKYKKGEKIPQETLTEIIRLATTAPSSWNLQHWKFILVEEETQKQKLLPIAYNQQQVVDCSTVVIVLGDVEADKNAEKIYSEAVKAGHMTEEAKQKLVQNIQQAYATVDQIGVHEAIKNASLAAMQLMLAAKGLGVESGPMGGFNAVGLREELRIPSRYVPVLMITLGYGAEQAHATPRFPVDEVVIRETF